MANSTTTKKTTAPKKNTPKVQKPVAEVFTTEENREEVFTTEEVTSVKEEIETVSPIEVEEVKKPEPKKEKKEEPKPTASDKVIVQLPGGKYELRLITPKGYKVLMKGSKEKCEKKAGF